MKKFLTLLMVIICSGYLTLSILDHVYSYALTRNPLLNIPKNKKYDFLIIGDSRVSSILEGPLTELTGRTSLVIPNYGGNLTDIPYILDYFFARGNSAKTVVTSIDLRAGSQSKSKFEWKYYAYRSKNPNYLIQGLPFTMYATHNKEVTIQKIWTCLNEPTDTSREEHRDMNIKQAYQPHRDQYRRIDPKSMHYEHLLHIYNKLRQYRVSNHLLIIPPLSPEYEHYNAGSEAYVPRLKEYGFHVMDFSHEYSDTSAFADLIHLKRKTYLDFTVKLADRLKSEGDIVSPKRRNDNKSMVMLGQSDLQK